MNVNRYWYFNVKILFKKNDLLIMFQRNKKKINIWIEKLILEKIEVLNINNCIEKFILCCVYNGQ